MRSNLLIATAFGALMMGAPAYGQTKSDGDAPVTPNDGQSSQPPNSAQLGDIIITAQRKTENLQKAPVAVAVIGGDTISNAGITAPGRLQELVPALSIQPTSSGNLIFIRGVGNFTLTSNSDPSTAFNFDDVYVGRPTSSNGVFYDLDRLEVLKGPQGTLYGRNATAGAINVIPTQPKLGELSGYATVGYGNYNALTAEAAINVPLGPNGALRVSGNYSKRDGYLKDGTSNDDTKAFRVQLKGELTSDLTVRATFDYAHVGGTGEGMVYIDKAVFNGTNFVITPSGLPEAEGLGTPASQAYRQTLVFAAIGAKANPLLQDQYLNNSYFGANLNIALRTGIGTFTIIPAWRYAHIDSIVRPGFIGNSNEKDDQESVELRFAAKRFSIFDFSAGLYYYNEKVRSIGALSLESAISFTDQRYATRSKAAYARLTANVTDWFRLTGGIRYTDDDKTFVGKGTSLAIVCQVRVAGVASCPNAPLIRWTKSLAEQPIVPPAGGAVPLGTSGAVITRVDSVNNAAIAQNQTTYRGAIEFDVGPRSLLYASVETGYRSGGFNFAAGRGPFLPEYITAYTFGLKNRFFNNRVQLNLEGFIWKYRDQQLSHIALDANNRPANITENIGRSTNKGFEAELTVAATKNTILNADVQYLNAKYDSFLYQTPVSAGRPFTGCPVAVSSNPAFYNVDCSGYPAFNAPKWTINFGLQQTFNVSDRYKFVFSADTQYRSSHYAFYYFTADELVGGVWRSNALLSFGPSDNRWSVSAYVRNIENKRTILFIPEHPSLTAATAQLAAPRTFGGRVSMKF
ncbi:MAG: TonB-dependent receptor [Sphingomonas sp.]|nr:TonB-dependent receptor [Sphingomonas sp.]